MARRPLSPEEEAFVASILEEESESQELRSLERRRPKRVWFFQRLSFWLGFILTIPFILNLIFLYVLFRITSLLGEGNVELLSKQELTPTVTQGLEAYGFGWITTALTLYEYRGVIILGIFAVFILLAALVYGGALLVRRRRARRSASTEEESHEVPGA